MIELALQKTILRFIEIKPSTADGHSDGKYLVGCSRSHDPEYREAHDLVLAFARPRATLLLSVTLLGTPTTLTKFIGQLHPVAMILWVALEQLANCTSAVNLLSHKEVEETKW